MKNSTNCIIEYHDEVLKKMKSSNYVITRLFYVILIPLLFYFHKCLCKSQKKVCNMLKFDGANSRILSENVTLKNTEYKPKVGENNDEKVKVKEEEKCNIEKEWMMWIEWKEYNENNLKRQLEEMWKERKELIDNMKEGWTKWRDEEKKDWEKRKNNMEEKWENMNICCITREIETIFEERKNKMKNEWKKRKHDMQLRELKINWKESKILEIWRKWKENKEEWVMEWDRWILNSSYWEKWKRYENNERHRMYILIEEKKKELEQWKEWRDNEEKKINEEIDKEKIDIQVRYY